MLRRIRKNKVPSIGKKFEPSVIALAEAEPIMTESKKL
jgi:hypothetical protein